VVLGKCYVCVIYIGMFLITEVLCIVMAHDKRINNYIIPKDNVKPKKRTLSVSIHKKNKFRNI
jgi:hypothetical protein